MVGAGLWKRGPTVRGGRAERVGEDKRRPGPTPVVIASRRALAVKRVTQLRPPIGLPSETPSRPVNGLFPASSAGSRETGGYRWRSRLGAPESPHPVPPRAGPSVACRPASARSGDFANGIQVVPATQQIVGRPRAV